MAVKKLYTERYVKAISDSIREKNGSTDTYTISQMSAAIAGLADKWTVIKKWFAKANESRGNLASGLAYYPDGNTYGLIPTQASVRMGVTVEATQAHGLSVKYLSINNDEAGVPGIVGNLSDWGDDTVDNYVPYWLTDFSWGAFSGYASSIDIDDLEFLRTGRIQVSELSEVGTLPLIYSILSGETAVSVTDFKNALHTIKYKDIVDSSSYDNLPFDIDTITGFVYHSTGDVQIISSTMSGAGVGTFNTSTGEYTGATGQYNILSSGLYGLIHDNLKTYVDPTWTNWGVISGFGYGIYTTEELAARILLHTEPIKDQNGNVVFPANCSISDFF